MRDEQICLLINRELKHCEGVCLLRNQQMKMRMDAMMEVLSGGVFFRTQKYILKKIDEVYAAKAKEYNEKLQAQLAKDRLKI